MEPGGRSPLRSDDEAGNGPEEDADHSIPIPAQVAAAAAAVAPEAAAEEDEHDVQPEAVAAAALPVAADQEEPNPEAVAAAAPNDYRRTGQLKAAAEEEEEEEEEEEVYDSFSLHPVMFTLTQQEEEWAKQVREAIDGLADLDIHFSDFMCVHLAIAGRGDLEWIIARAYKMQDVHKEYKILGTYEEACVAVRQFMDLFASVIIHFSCDPGSGDCVLILDGCYPMKEMWKRQKTIDITIRAGYYLCYAQFPSFECVRVGNVHMFEAAGYEWGLAMTDVKQFSQLTNDVPGTFPVVLQATRFYNTPTILNCVLSMVKKVIPKDVASKYSIGNTFAGGASLRDFYLVPTPEAANQRNYETICRSFKLRFESERQFSLS